MMRINLKPCMLIPVLLLCSVSSPQTKPVGSFYYPTGLIIDSKDNLYVCNESRMEIVKIDPNGQSSAFLSVALYRQRKWERWPGSELFDPAGLAIDQDDTIYVADKASGDILKVSPEGRVTIVTGNKGHVVKDGNLNTAAFKKPFFITLDRNKNIYVTDQGGEERTNTAYGLIRKITPQGEVSTLKDNNNTELHFDAAGMVCDSLGNLFVCDRTGRCIKKISPEGNITIIAGLCGKRMTNPIFKEGDVKTAEFMEPWYIALGKNGDIYFSDIRLNRIIKLAGGKIATAAGNSTVDLEHSNIQGYSEPGFTDGRAKMALFNQPMGIGFDKQGNLFIADCANQCVRKLSTGGMVSTYCK